MSLKDGKYKIYTLDSYIDNSRKCITVKDRSKVQCADIILSSDINDDSQVFSIKKDGDNYIITSVHSSLVLDVLGANKAEGTKIIQYPFHGNSNQRWNFIPFKIPSYNGYIPTINNSYVIQTCMNKFTLKVGTYGIVIDNAFQQQGFVLEEVQ